jgi:transcriptional regulator with XRE-family HTH domain
MTTTTTVPTDIRSRRERLGISRLALAVRTGVSPAWLAALEAGLRPVGSRALARVEAALDKLEREWRLEPGVGVSGYRGDTDGPTGAAA